MRIRLAVPKLLLLSSLLLSCTLTAISQQSDLLNQSFTGKYRARSKTAVVRANGEIKKPKTYTSVKSLLKSLKPDSIMRLEFPYLASKKCDSMRSRPELSNIEVTGWIHSAKFEGGAGDRDFHVIVGSTAKLATATFMNMEVTGLPKKTAKDYQVLLDARDKFLKLFPDGRVGQSFKPFDPPIKVKLKGSLFFDGDHQAGCVACPGPAFAKPQSVWEIHPVYDIVGQ